MMYCLVHDDYDKHKTHIQHYKTNHNDILFGFWRFNLTHINKKKTKHETNEINETNKKQKNPILFPDFAVLILILTKTENATKKNKIT